VPFDSDAWYCSDKSGKVTVSGKPSVDVLPGTLGSILRQAGLKKYEMAMQYLVIVEKGATSFGAYAPDLAGCAVAGGTCEAVLALVKSASDGFEAIGLCGHFFQK